MLLCTVEPPGELLCTVDPPGELICTKEPPGELLYNNNNNTFIDKENQYDTNVSVIKIKSSLWYQIIFIIKNA